MAKSAEELRLEANRLKQVNWSLWGPYLAERQWGTVREDYSPKGDAWNSLTYWDAISRAYRWGEDGIAGFCDDRQQLCLSLALWNEKDSVLKERFFGLTNQEGNHGEDVKELYYYLDGTPTHSYMKMLYKYPMAAFPYGELTEANRNRSRTEPEFELSDTSLLQFGRYFDVVVEYAKACPEDILMRITVHNRSQEPAKIHLLPQLWFRNNWSWDPSRQRPVLEFDNGTVLVTHDRLKGYRFSSEAEAEWLFCENETNTNRLYGVTRPGYFKDGFHDRLIHHKEEAVNPARKGSKCAAWIAKTIAPDSPLVFRLRLSNRLEENAFADFDSVFKERFAEANEFYDQLQSGIRNDDAKTVQRQAFAGMLWSKQFYFYEVDRWLDGDDNQPAPDPSRRHDRNAEWRHFSSSDVLSMPDTWEYPWFAAWDTAFHCIPLAMIDAEFAKQQLLLLTKVRFLHPNGQIPAYEWSFSDVNPPVHAWAAWRVFQMDRKRRGGDGDLLFLERILHKLMLNFTWWVNRKDAHGRNIFQGGFLGLDNIGVFDRSAPLPTGGYVNQADATSWMAMYCLNLMTMSLEMAKHNSAYEDIATKFFDHFLHIAEAMTNIADEGRGLWDEHDKFYYDILNLPDDRVIPLKVRSMVGLIPLFAVATIEPETLERLPHFNRRMMWTFENRPHLSGLVSRWNEPGRGERRLLSLLRGHRIKKILSRMLDESEFLSDFGVRALSRYHLDHPYVFEADGSRLEVKYVPGDSDSGLFGGNSNWRGPIWFPVNYLIIESLQKFHHYYGDDFLIECPTGSGKYVTILDAANEISKRLSRIFLKDSNGHRPLFGDDPLHRDDPHFRDHVLFYEYFHGDDGHGIGASHQTGWTALIAKLLQPRQDEPLH